MRPTEPSGSPDLHLRPARRDDVTAMAQVQSQARAAAPMPPVLASAVHVALVEGWDDDQLWVAERSGTVVGYVRFVLPDERRVGWLDDLYVLPAHAGTGVGSALLGLVKSWLPGGFGLWAFVSNRPARAFYARHGLREVDLVAAEESPHGEAEVELEWGGRATLVTTPGGHAAGD